jgi:tight adherence protein B
MLIALTVFVVVTLSVLGAYVALTRLPEVMKRRQLDRRLRDVSAPAVAPSVTGGESVVSRKTNGLTPAFDRMAAGTRGGAWLGRLIEQSGKRTTPGVMLMASVVSAIALGVVAATVTHLWWAPLAGALAGLPLPMVWLIRQRSVRMRRFEEQFPEALDLLSRAIRAGHAFQTAMSMVADELSAPVGTEFKKTFEQQNFGLPMRDALNAMTERIPIIDVRFFVTAVLIQRETGGNLSEILDNLSHVVRERFKILRQVRVHTAHGRFTGYVLLAMPAALAIALTFINPEMMDLLFKRPMGQTMLMGAVVMQTIGFVWIKQVIKIEV